MKKLLNLLVFSVFACLALLSCQKETAETTTISGKWACADGGLIDEYLDFSSSTICYYASAEELPFMDNIIWNYSESKFTKSQKSYYIKDNVLYVDDTRLCTVKISAECLILDGKAFYEQVKGFKAEPYSSLSPSVSSITTGYAATQLQVGVTIQKPLSSPKAVLSATTNVQWISNIKFTKINESEYLMLFDVAEVSSVGNGMITISYPGANSVSVEVKRTSSTAIQLDGDHKDVSALGGQFSFGYTIVQPIGSNALTAVSDQSWVKNISVEKTSATTGTVNYTVEENTTGALRNATITCSYSGAASVTYAINQSLLTVEDLSAEGTANCYLVTNSGNYKFKATVKGRSSESVGTPASAETLWETYGTNIAISAGDLITNVRLIDDYVHFSTNPNMNPGNASIAVKDGSGTILWSWHIWICPGYSPSAAGQSYNNGAGTFMDRNLGATSSNPADAQAIGLLYQWGRKDPFLGTGLITTSTQAASSITWPAAKLCANCLQGGTNALAYSIANPTTFITGGSSASASTDWNDWYATSAVNQNDNLWEGERSKYDPCPRGWKVPEGYKTGRFMVATGTNAAIDGSSLWNSSYYGMDLGQSVLAQSLTSWYLAAGAKYGTSGTLSGIRSNGYWWTSTPAPTKEGATDTSMASMFRIRGTSTAKDVNASVSWFRSMGYNVRCVSESSPAVVPVTAVNIDKTSATLKVGETVTVTASVIPSNANITTLNVTSSAPAIATVASSGSGKYTITAVSGGTATIHFTAYNGISVDCTVTVTNDPPVGEYTDLSEAGTANCYFIKASGKYKFKATVRGNGVTTSNGITATISPAKVEEYYKDGDTVVPAGYQLYEGYIYFEVPSPVPTGTSLILVKDSAGKTIWSWHIWVNPNIADVTATGTSGTSVWMNMNLGAHQIGWNENGYMGYYYQWGRKDPFCQHKTTAAMDKPFVSRASFIDGSVENSILNPAIFYGSYYYGSDPTKPETRITDWASYRDLTKVQYDLWCRGVSGPSTGGEVVKTMWDPCPPGYNVPTVSDFTNLKESCTAWSFNTTQYSWVWTDGANTLSFPQVGLRNAGVDSTIWGKGDTKASYLQTALPANAYVDTGDVYKILGDRGWIKQNAGVTVGNEGAFRAFGHVVRCVKSK